MYFSIFTQSFNFNLYAMNYSCNILKEGNSKYMIKTPVSCTKLSDKAPTCWGNTLPSYCGPHTLPKITWLLNCVASTLSDQYQVLSLRSFTSKSLRMQQSFSQKPYIHSRNQKEVLSNNAVPVPCLMSFQSMRSWN